MNIQKKIVRLMAFKSYFDHHEPIFKDLNLFNIFKIPEFFKDYFVTNNQAFIQGPERGRPILV